MDVSVIVAVIALVVSLVSLALNFRESRRREVEVAFVRAEGGRRDEEMRLLHEEAARGRGEDERRDQARLTITPGPVESSPLGILFRFEVTNSGLHPASNILLRLDREGYKAGEAVALAPVLRGASMPLDVLTPPVDRYNGPYLVTVSWEDGRRLRVFRTLGWVEYPPREDALDLTTPQLA